MYNFPQKRTSTQKSSSHCFLLDSDLGGEVRKEIVYDPHASLQVLFLVLLAPSALVLVAKLTEVGGAVFIVIVSF